MKHLIRNLMMNRQSKGLITLLVTLLIGFILGFLVGGGCTRSQLAANITARLMHTDFEHPDGFLQKYKEYRLSEEGNPE